MRCQPTIVLMTVALLGCNHPLRITVREYPGGQPIAGATVARLKPGFNGLFPTALRAIETAVTDASGVARLKDNTETIRATAEGFTTVDLRVAGGIRDSTLELQRFEAIPTEAQAILDELKLNGFALTSNGGKGRWTISANRDGHWFTATSDDATRCAKALKVAIGIDK